MPISRQVRGEIKGAGVPLFSYWHWEALAGSDNISLTLILALGSPSVQRHMAHYGTNFNKPLKHNLKIGKARLPKA